MRAILPLAFVALLAAAAPLLPRATASRPPLRPWPTRFEGRPLRALPPGSGDAMLARDFPGHVARFSDGRRQLVLRQVARATRSLHPPRDCFGAMGYAITPLPMRTLAGALSSCFEAVRGKERLRVCEQVRSRGGTVHPDMPGWYWHALTMTDRGPWLAVMTVERVG
jgi:hypothetical protein